ncbi:MAG: dienelactone hydrolase family protein [Chloroflexi bacterium]|nr:dienelactone hydrolase family protein [Chloroflexota bacterium]
MAGSEQTIERDGVRVNGYLAEPPGGGGARGAVVVLQEWWGLNDDIRSIADRFAAEGYAAFAPDLYHGTVANEPAEAQKLAMSLEQDVAAREIDAVIGWLKAARGARKVGCIGFCMGGGLVLSTAMRPTSQVDAAHAFYSGNMPTPDQAAAIRIPVMGSYGALDDYIPQDKVLALRDALQGNGVANDFRIYEGAGHSFFNHGAAYHEPSSADAWQRTLRWFGAHVAS